MEKLKLDLGLRRYRIGGGVLEFNPTDPGLYSRLSQCLTELEALEQALGEDPMAALDSADRAAREALSRVFPGNDLEAIFQGVSLLAVGANGRRLLENFLEALSPVLRQGAMDCAKAEADKL